MDDMNINMYDDHCVNEHHLTNVATWKQISMQSLTFLYMGLYGINYTRNTTPCERRMQHFKRFILLAIFLILVF